MTPGSTNALHTAGAMAAVSCGFLGYADVASDLHLCSRAVTLGSSKQFSSWHISRSRVHSSSGAHGAVMTAASSVQQKPPHGS